jgi:hypothetical protein
MEYTAYEQLRYWLPLLSAFGLIIGAYRSGKKNIADFCDKLLSNHLTHIEQATASTEVETKKTNSLLEGQAGKLDMVQNTLHQHHERQLEVWRGVTETLVVLKERTRACTRRKTTPKKRARNG